MAPSLVVNDPVVFQTTADKRAAANGYKEVALSGPRDYKNENELNGGDGYTPASYPKYLPVWDNEKDLPGQKYSPLEPFTHYEHGKDADPSFKNLLNDRTEISELTATIGAEVHGVQLSQLNNAGKDELALFVAKHKVVAFRDQDFADLDIQSALDIGSYFGRLHIHPTSPAPKGYPEVHLVHRGAADTTAKKFFETRTSSITWHSDVTYEEQPPGTTFLYVLDAPRTGGDTLFLNMVEAYNRLSPAFRERLHGLKALHSGFEQVDVSKARGGAMRRDPVANEHPVVRTHPTTGEKALFVNPQFTRSIVGYKKEESDNLLKFLYDHMAFSQDLQARVKWAPKTVVVWDNRVAAHSAVLDWTDGQRRHIARITPQAERPTESFN